MRSEVYDMLTEMQTLRINSKDFIDKAMKLSVNGDTLKYMDNESFSLLQDTFKLIDETYVYLDKSINCIEKLLEDQYKANGKIDKIYDMLIEMKKR